MKKIFFLFFLFQFRNFLFAQDSLLTLEQSIKIALKNNYSILLAKNDAEIAANNNSLGNAGFLPQLNLNANGSSSNYNTNQKYTTGTEVNKEGVKSSNINAGLGLNWTLFDGMKMFATKDKMEELEMIGELSTKIQIENTIEKIILAYSNVIQQKAIEKAILEAINIYQERAKIAETKFNIGSASKVDLLQAKVDLNEQKSALLKQEINLLESKTNLNYLLSRKPEMPLEVVDSIVISSPQQFEELKSLTMKKNDSLQFAQRNINIANFSLKEIHAQQLPTIAFNTNYIFSRSENQAGFILLNQNQGLNYGLTFNWLLFNGFNVNRQISNAKINLQSAKLIYDDVKKQVESSLIKAYRHFQNDLQALALEEENVKLAKENVTIAFERFRLGATNSLELKQAQQSYEDGLSRLATAKFNSKVSETKLMKLNGELIR